MWDNVKNFFQKLFGKETDNSGQYVGQQDELLSELKKMYDDYNSTHEEKYVSIADSIPEEPNYEYKKYQGKTIDEIEKDTNDKYSVDRDNKIELVKDNYDKNSHKINGKIQSAQDSFDQNVKDIIAKHYLQNKSNKNNNLKAGLVRSSIDTQMQKNLEDSTKEKIETSTDDKKKLIEGYSKEIENLQKEKADAIENWNITYAQKISDEIQSLSNKMNDEIKKIDDYNFKVDEKVEKYKKDRLNTIMEHEKNYYSNLSKKNYIEKNYGYSGEKKQEYAKRLEMAEKFYDSLPVNDALKLIENNNDLKNYLGLNYSQLYSNLLRKKEK